MKIILDHIDSNPHRNMKRNPIQQSHVAVLVTSIERNEWGENVIVRRHPTEEGRFQLAYGHNRLAALRWIEEHEGGATDAEFIVKDITDWGMLCWMVDENESQRLLTPELIYENIESGINYLEPIIQASETIDDFTQALQICNAQTSPQNYAIVRNNVLSGEGIGARFLAKTLPGDKSTSIHNINAVVASHYQSARTQANVKRTKAAKVKAKAKRSAASMAKDINEARQLEKEAEAHDAEASALETTAKSLKAVATQDVLLQFPNAAKMTAFAEAVKRESIPAEKHQALVDHLEDTPRKGTPEWSPVGSQNYKREIAAWWFKASGRAMKDRVVHKREAFKQKHKEVSIDDFSKKIPANIRHLILELDAITPYVDQMENPTLNGSIVKACYDLIESATALKNALDAGPSDVITEEQKALTFE